MNSDKQVEINDFTTQMLLKYILGRECMHQKDLAIKMNKIWEKDVLPGSLATKLSRGNLRYNEMVDICNALGYRLTIEKRK